MASLSVADSVNSLPAPKTPWVKATFVPSGENEQLMSPLAALSEMSRLVPPVGRSWMKISAVPAFAGVCSV